MIIGQTLDWGGAGATYFSPWFPRGGSGARFTVEIIDVSSPCLAEERRTRITRNISWLTKHPHMSLHEQRVSTPVNATQQSENQGGELCY